MFKRIMIIACYITIWLLVFAVDTAYPGETLKPRYIPSKPAKFILADYHDPNHVMVKFRDDLDIGLDERQIPIDRAGQVMKSDGIRELSEKLAGSDATWKRATGTSEANLDRLIANAETNLHREIADLNNYFLLTLNDNWNTAFLIDALNAFPEIEIAYPLSYPAPPPLPGDYRPMQGYIDEPDNGIGAPAFWAYPGGKGQNVKICDLEQGYIMTHQDLPPIEFWVPEGYHWDHMHDDDHGTAVLGEMVSLDNGWGTTGASPDAHAAMAPVCYQEGYLFQVALEYAVTMLTAGDVILIEQQMLGPGPGRHIVPMEWDLAVYNTVLVAVGNGIHVVEAGANGYSNLDDEIFQTGHAPFMIENHSGAIMVGAAAAPPEFGGSDVEHSRLDFSNHGQRVDVHAWGEQVMTAGYGFYYDEEGIDYFYISDFGGTSSASPIVASAVAIIESIIEEQTGQVLAPDSMRHLLVNTGIPQQAGTFPVSDHIGPMPNLAMALEWVGIDQNRETLPSQILTAKNYPNPFNSSTVIEYHLPEASAVTIAIYDIRGRLIETLANVNQQPGTYLINWDAGDRPSGVYFYKIAAEDKKTIGTLTLVK